MFLPDSLTVPAIVRLDAALRLAIASVATLLAVRLASGSGVLLALGAVLRLEALIPPHAATARQLAPATATEAIRAKPGPPWNIRFSHQNVTYFHKS
jgi:hypothetical protein